MKSDYQATAGGSDPQHIDVLLGRGGGTNFHPGNIRFRRLVEAKKIGYVLTKKKLMKQDVAAEIVEELRSEGVRFLQKEATTGLFFDVGDKKARAKTSQALREKAPEIREKLNAIEDEQPEQMAAKTNLARFAAQRALIMPPTGRRSVSPLALESGAMSCEKFLDSNDSPVPTFPLDLPSPNITEHGDLVFLSNLIRIEDEDFSTSAPGSTELLLGVCEDS